MRAKTAVFLVVGSWIVVSLFYYNNFNLIKFYTNDVQIFKSKRPVLVAVDSKNGKLDTKWRLNVQYSQQKKWMSGSGAQSLYCQGTDDYLINTTGCYIPNYAKTIKFVEAKDQKLTCGHRAIFVDKDGPNIKFRINSTLMKKHYKGSQRYQCCYRFVSRSTIAGQEDTHVTYSQCTNFDTGTTVELKEEVVVVSCATVPYKQNKNRHVFYEDAYIILKKLKKDTSGAVVTQKNWNVLIFGMDTMSRARFLNSMPRTASYFNQHGWLDYRGYQKVGYNTFPNLMSLLTGRNMSTVYRKCSGIMDNCNDDIIWSKFQNSGYITAYGEDFLTLPDTFSRYNGFKVPPTNHYMRPLFLTGETRNGNLVCTKQVPSAIHALHYALDFVNSYKNEKFFGMFWLNSYSHNLDNLPTLLDNDLTDFWNKLNGTGALSNTFVFFVSDHGIRYGKMRTSVESYYEERLPMFFMWAPLDFQAAHTQYNYNLQLNQRRLTTPYDLHVTLRNVLQLSSEYSLLDGESEACPQCTSLFYEKLGHRTCVSAGVHEKWCSCHNLIRVSDQEYGAAYIIELAVSYIQNKTKSINTTKCKKCSTLQLKTVLRTHKHVDKLNNETRYVIAFGMSPGNVAYEASVKEDENGFHIIKPTQTISEYNSRGSCVVSSNDREFCVCEKKRKCT